MNEPSRAGDQEAFLDSGGRLNHGWRAVLTTMLGLGFGPSVILLMCFGVFAPALHRVFGWSAGAIGLGATIISLAVMVLSPVQGWLVDRFGSRRLVLICLPLFGLGVTAMAAQRGDIAMFYLACGLLPILALGLWPLSYLQLCSTWFDRRFGLALGLANAGVGLGAAAAPLLIGALFALAGWRAAYLGLGLVILVVIWPLAALFLHANPIVRGKGPADGSQALGLTLPQVVRQASFWMLLVAFVGLGVISGGLLVHQVNILMAHGMTQPAAIGLQSVLGLASIAGRVTAGWLLDRVRVSRLMPVLLVVAAGACLLYASDLSGPILVLGAATVGFVIGAEFDVLAYALRRYFGLATFGLAFGLIFSGFQLGGAFGAAFVGLSLERLGGYGPSLLVMTGLCALSALIFFRLGPYRYATREGAATSAGAGGPSSAPAASVA